MATADVEKSVMLIGLDKSDNSFYALEWILDHFFAPYALNLPYKLVVIHAKPSSSALVALGGAGVHSEVFPAIESDLRKIAHGVIDRAKELCISKSVGDVQLEIVEGDARNVLCEAVDKYQASTLIVGSHGYGAIKRAVLGSISDYCAHHARCSVMIVKKPKIKD